MYKRQIEFSFQSDFDWQINKNNKANFGASVTQTEVDYLSTRNDTITILERDQTAMYGSAYVSNESTILSNITLNTGLRASYYDMSDKPLFEPRVNLIYKITPKIKVKAAYSWHYQFVNRIVNENISEGSREFWLLADNESVKISSAIHYVLGASYETNGYLFDVEGYYKDLSDISEFSLRFRRGLEIRADELFFTGDGIATVSYTHLTLPTTSRV